MIIFIHNIIKNTAIAVILMCALPTAYADEWMSDAEPTFEIHGVMLGMDYNQAEEAIRKEGFEVDTEARVSFNLKEYKRDSESLSIMYTSKDSDGRIYSISFNTKTYPNKSVKDIENFLRNKFDREMMIYSKNEKKIMVRSATKKSKYGKIIFSARSGVGKRLRGQVKLATPKHL